MTRLLAALATALVALPAQDKPEKPADDFVEIKWDLQKEDRYEFKWTFDDSRKATHAINKGNNSIGTEDIQTSDRRDVTGEIFLKEGENGAPPKIVLTLRKVQWAVSNKDFDATVTYAEGKKADLQTKVKGDPKATAQVQDNIKMQANLIGDSMKKGVEGEFTIHIDTRRTETSILKDGHPSKPGPSLFDRIYLHSPVPNQLVRIGQTWREKVDSEILPSGMIDAAEFDYKVASANATTATFKANYVLPIMKPPAAGDVRAVTTTGSFNILCDFVWNRAGYLQSSKEAVSFNKKVDATGKDANFYKETANWTITSAVAIKRKAPPKDDKNPDEKKPDKK